jgi:hypothetical protein
MPKRRRKLLSLSLVDNHFTEGKITRLALTSNYTLHLVISISVGITGGGLLRVYSCSYGVANRCRFKEVAGA